MSDPPKLQRLFRLCVGVFHQPRRVEGFVRYGEAGAADLADADFELGVGVGHVELAAAQWAIRNHVARFVVGGLRHAKKFATEWRYLNLSHIELFFRRHPQQPVERPLWIGDGDGGMVCPNYHGEG